MLSLVKIRIKYIIRNPCLLFWTYILIPGLVLISAIYMVLYREKYTLETYEKYVIPETKYFMEEKFENLKHFNFLNFTAFIADNNQNCEKIQNFLKKKNISIRDNNLENYPICATLEKNLNNFTLNIIKISKTNGKYRVILKSRGGNDTSYKSIYRNTEYYQRKKLENYIMFKGPDLDESVITDAYYVYKDNNLSNFTKYDIFFELQSLLSQVLIELEGKSDTIKSFKMNFGFNKYPDSYRISSPGQYIEQSLVAFLVTLQFALITYNLNMRMIDEKESKLNILLERQGINKFQNIFSWFFTHCAVSLISIVGFIILLSGTTNGHLYLSMINVLLYSLSLFSVCVFFSIIIKTTKTGATGIKFYNFGSIFLGFVLLSQKTLKVTKVVFSLIPHINFYMIYYTSYCLGNFDKVNFNMLFLKATKTGYFEAMVMYIVDIIIYFGLAVFIQSYKESGLNFSQFILSWFKKVSRNVELADLINEDRENLNEEENPKYKKHFQELSQLNKQKVEANLCLKLVNVSKSFEEVKAVKCFNGELFTNEIFCLLGHNGAGKTTTINMISGIYDPDEGDIFFNGRSLITDKKYLYENIGLCNQENIFFDYLTVEEHLEYMCKIKGSFVNQQEIDELITKIDLLPKKYALCSTLSGGQKRKLCIALALIGNSKIILLDEPTSGMDFMARRSLWEFLKKYKKNRIILLTTHFLDEAEYLGDRIGIMSDGQYICCGTSSYLKSKYPCGFNINLIINPDKFDENYKYQFYNEILKYEPNTEIKVASKGVFSINILPHNKNIQEIFDYIETNQSKFGIVDYTVASTSLEDVFLKINNKANINYQQENIEDKNEFSNSLRNFLPMKSGFLTQLQAQIIRGFYPFYRNKALFFLELLSGLGFVYIFIFFFADSIRGILIKKINLIEVLNSHKIYINGIDKDFFTNSDTYKSYGTYITLSQIKEKSDTIEQFMDNVYKNAFVNIAKGSLCVKEKKDEKILYEVYNTEINTNLFGFLYANTMLFISSFLKKEYNIDATILPEIEFNPLGANSEGFLNNMMDSMAMIIVCLINFFGFVIFLGGLMFEKIKEKRTNIKHLLYLSGSNIFSYWVGFYIVDYIKLTIFSILLILPVYTINSVATFFGLDMIFINISALSFIYFITFFCSKDDEGAKVLFLFVFGFISIILILVIVFPNKTPDYIINLYHPYKLTIFDMTPVTSMILSFIRLIMSYTLYSELDKALPDFPIDNMNGIARPKTYLLTSYLAQLVNIALYTFLLLFAESGILGKFIHYLEIKLYGDNDIHYAPSSSPDINNEQNLNNNNYSEDQLIKNKYCNIISNDDIINTNSSNINNQNNINQFAPNQYNNQNYIQFNNQNPYYSKNNDFSQSLDFNFNGENFQGDPLQNPYVEKEIQKVLSDKELTTRIINVTKTFYPCFACFPNCKKNKIRAINHLHLGLEPNEKFALLGFNGSGKTTTFRAITNEILFDNGSIDLFGFDTKKQFNTIRTMIGYCPQSNPLFDFMKVREIVQFYSRLKSCEETPEEICEKFGLSNYLNTYTVNLSGGNKRKLTFALSMMNKPSLLLLDEPSTGVDPESRRIMWKNINDLSDSGHKYNMILTTHSMEEAEILCDTVSWFKAGNFIILGNPEQLKLKYSVGYKLHIKFEQSKFEKKGENDINKTFHQICNVIERFDKIGNYILKHKNLAPHLIALMDLVIKIKDKINKVSLYQICKDQSFELVIQIIKDKKKDLFCQILNMKNNDEVIEELTISMQSLENILTALN